MAVKGSATVTLTQYRDIQSVTRYYKLRPAGSSAPLKPETKPPSSDWTDSEPTCDISKELYFCDLTIFSNGQWEYSKVSKSSSYEAAKEAYNKAQNASDTASAAQSKADAINSKGEQLVINGNAILGNNTNFTQWLYDGSMANGSGGSFTLSPGTRKIIINDEFFGLDPLKDYRFEFDAISKESTSKHYSMLVFYDVDKKEIMALNHKYISEVTELAVDLKNGDTVVHLNDISSFNTNTGTHSYERGFIFWNYTNSFGYKYPPKTYSRNVFYNLWEDSGVNKADNTIALKSPWSKGTIPAGTKLSQCSDGANYKYQPLSYSVVPSEWTHYSCIYSGTDYSGTNISSKFPPGTAYCKVGFLWNYNNLSSTDQLWITNVSVYEDYKTGIANAQGTADSKRRVFYNTPTVPYDAGDLWVQGSGGDILRCAQAKTSTGSYNRNDWVLASKYTDDSALNTWIEGDFATTIQGLEDGIIDAKIETYYQATDPSTGWSDTQKSEHKGDLWYNSTASVQKYYRWSGTAWQELTATPPHAVFDSIDKKATIYTGTTTPTNPSSGDLWFKGADEPILTYVNSSWVEYNKYTDDSTLNAWLTNTYAVDKTNLQNQIDGKAETWYQATDPSLDWSAADKPNHEGDLWYNTSDNTTWYYTGSAWSQQSIPTSVFNNINGKANIFVGSTAPENPKTGDLWLESASSDILTYVGGSWVKYNKYTDDTKAEQAQTDIDNLKLTKIDRFGTNASMNWNGNILKIEAVDPETNVPYAVEIGGNGIEFKYDSEAVAMINQDQLVIDKTVVLTEMQVNRYWTWRTHDNNNLCLQWIGGSN